MRKLITLAAMLAVGCKPETGPNGSLGPIDGGEIRNDPAISLRVIAQFEDRSAHYKYRNVIVLSNSTTKQSWIGITGIGISEMEHRAKTTQDSQ